MISRRFDWPALAWILLLCAATLVAYGRSVNLFFSQDDFSFLARAARVTSVGDLLRSLVAADHFYRPVPRVATLVAEMRLFGLNAGGYHLVNLGLHVSNALLLFLLCRRLSAKTLLSGLAGLFFATHHVPFVAVYWVSGVQELCMVLLLMLSVHFYLRSLAVRSRLWFAFSLLSFGLALLSKETSVTFPVVLLLSGLVWQRQHGTARTVRQIVISGAGFAAVLALYLILRWQKAAATISFEGPYAWALAPGVFFRNLYTYLCDALSVRGWIALAPQRAAWASGVFLALAGVAAAASRRHRPTVGLGLAWFLVSALPVLFLSGRAYSFYAYLPLAGMAIALEGTLGGLLERIRAGRWLSTPQRHLARGLLVSLLVVGWLWFCAGQIRAAEKEDAVGILAKGTIARRALAELQCLYRTLPPGGTLYVEGLTERDAWAVGRGDMFRLYYPGVEVVVVAEGQTSETAGNQDGSGYVYRYGGDR